MINRKFILLISLILIFMGIYSTVFADTPISKQSETCIDCHSSITPGIVSHWKNSVHSKITPAEALEKDSDIRKISSEEIPSDLQENAVGCYECHGLNTENHKDSFEHFGKTVNVVVSPADCSVCHPKETEEYKGTKKAEAYYTLKRNPLFMKMVNNITGVKKFKNGKFLHQEATPETEAGACFSCHGTKVEVNGMKTVNTKIGKIEVPDLDNYPNQGVGRINPDGTKGSCASCHPRHSFSIEVARKPYTCGQCHLKPDVPAFNVYKESKHGNIFESKKKEANWKSYPWTIGKDITFPTCATCHNARLENPQGETVVKGTHNFSKRLWVRIFGLIYSHPQPKSGATYKIENADGLSFPTTFDNKPASEYLISSETQEKRKETMKTVCTQCHSTNWAEKQFERLHQSIKETDIMVKTATKLVKKAWEKGIADNTNPFDEPIEKKWIKQWLFYANSVRHANAMMGPDYAAFKLGWWDLTENLREMKDELEMKSKLAESSENDD